MTVTKNSLSMLFLAVSVCVSVVGQEHTGPPAPAMAGSTSTENRWHKFWNQVELHRKRVNVWPEPFAQHDRELVRGPFRQMADNGWKNQNTFTDYLFDPSSNELTIAGQAKLYHVLTQIPPHRRQVYVLEATTQEETAARLASVYRTIAQIAPQTPPCTVMTTKIAPRGGEGWYMYEVDEAYRTSFTDPLRTRLSSSCGSATQGGYGNSNSNHDATSGSGAGSGNGGNN
jgi:hypothetical protein